MKKYTHSLLITCALSVISFSTFAATEMETRVTPAQIKTARKVELEKAVEKIRYLPESEVEKHRETLTRLENYLTGLTTVEADFTQAASDGSLAAGKFSMQRPGKMRWEYAPPTPILIIASGSQLVYFDKELEQVTYVPIGDSLVSFLTQDKIRFGGPVGIEYLEETPGVIRLTISQRENPEDGKLTLEFSDKPLLIRKMIVLDGAGQVTNVSLNNARFGGKLDPDLFVFHDTRKKRPR